jgi:phage terminase large subunit-like protein
MPHQSLIADVGGELLPDGSPAFREIIFTLMRQQGKTTLFLSFSVERCTLRGSAQKVAYTAQTGSDARKKLLDDQVPIIQESPLWKAVRRVSRAQGSEGIAFRNGSRIDVLASSVSAGHGKIIDLGEIDEAFDDIDDRREQAMLPAMITRSEAQLLIGSTMGTDASVYLNRKVEAGRAAALAGRTSGIAYFEWSIPEYEDIDDPRVWARHMPALGITIREAEVAHARLTMTDGDFRRAFGNQRTHSAERLIPEATWRAACSSTAEPRTGIVFAVEVSQDRDMAAIVAAGYDSDGTPTLAVMKK